MFILYILLIFAVCLAVIFWKYCINPVDSEKNDLKNSDVESQEKEHLLNKWKFKVMTRGDEYCL